MHSFLVNLLIGIIGGIYSSVIVSRVFLLRAELCILRLRPATDAFGNGHPAVPSGRLNQSVSLALITTV